MFSLTILWINEELAQLPSPAAPRRPSTWWHRVVALPPPSPWQPPQGGTTPHRQSTS